MFDDNDDDEPRLKKTKTVSHKKIKQRPRLVKTVEKYADDKAEKIDAMYKMIKQLKKDVQQLSSGVKQFVDLEETYGILLPFKKQVNVLKFEEKLERKRDCQKDTVSIF